MKKVIHRPVVFTIVSANYIGFAATLMQSVREQHPEVARYIILSDAYHNFSGVDLAADVIACDDLDINLIENMKLWYTVVEFNTSVKPFAFRHMFQKLGYTTALYIDPDIYLYSPLGEVYDALKTHSIVLTPHMMKPLQDGKEPSDLTIMKSGVYNLGFLGARNNADCGGLMDWWCDRLFAHCRSDVPGNMFTDQRWMDLAPVLVNRPYILRHPGYNVAYWNIAHRVVEQAEDGKWTVNGQTLRFFHFSGIKPDDSVVYSKHQNRFTYENMGIVRELCTEYREAVLANRWYEFSKVDYAYGKFRDGRKISDTARHWVLRAIDAGKLSPKKSLRIGSTFFDEADDDIAMGATRITRFAYQFWLDRPDLRHAFDLSHAQGFNGYLDWFCGAGAEAEGVNSLDLQAARQLRSNAEIGAIPVPKRTAPPPWAPIASSSWDGAARSVQAWLRADVIFNIGSFRTKLPKQVALLWERRADLQQHFPMTDSLEQTDAFLTWALTEGLIERSIDAHLFSDEFLDEFVSVSGISSHYGDVPITRGLILTRTAARSREGLETWRQFPVEKQARAEHGFWFSYIAPGLYGWAPEFYAPVKAYFDRRSHMTLDGYSFTFGMLTLWEARKDLQRTFHLGTANSRAAYLRWLVFHAPREFKVNCELLCPGIRDFLVNSQGFHKGLSRLLEFVYEERHDLQSSFDLDTDEGIAALLDWSEAHLQQYLIYVGLGILAAPSLLNIEEPPPEVIRAHVALTGHWDASSGLGEDMRSSVAALDACGYSDYVIVNLDADTMLTAAKALIPAGATLEVAWNIVHRNAETSIEDWHSMRRLRILAEKTVGHWHWELDRLPSAWAHAYSYYDEIWASSRFAMDAFAISGARPVRLLPGAVTAPVVGHEVSRAALGLKESATLFLFMFDFASYATRKNPHAVIAAFEMAFPKGDEDVQLVIKTQNARKMPALSAELGALAQDGRVILKDAKLSREELVSLIGTANAFVSLTRSEGYGRAPAEAMLLGRPVILTGYSGTNDFADADTACVVNYTLVPVQPNEYPGVEGQSWAEADVAHAAHYMRWVHHDPAAARALGERGRKKVSEMLAPEKVGRAMLELLCVKLTEPASGPAVPQ